MKKQHVLILVALLTVALSVGACGSLGGGKKKEQAAPTAEPAAAPASEPAAAPASAVAVPVEAATPTMGKEFLDLQKAHEQGAITDEEFQRAKAKLLGESEQPTTAAAEQPEQMQKETEETPEQMQKEPEEKAEHMQKETEETPEQMKKEAEEAPEQTQKETEETTEEVKDTTK